MNPRLRPLAAILAVLAIIGAFVGGAATDFLDPKPTPVAAIQPPTIDLAPNPGDPGNGAVSVPLSGTEVELFKLGFALDYVDARPDLEHGAGILRTSTEWLGSDSMQDPAYANLEVSTLNGDLNWFEFLDGAETCFLSPTIDYYPVTTLLNMGKDVLERSAVEWPKWTEKDSDGEPLHEYEFIMNNGNPDNPAHDNRVFYTCYHDIVKGG